MATDSASPGADGKCGSQHPMATCLPMQGRTCCSINGFCGSNETYCLESNGCQSGCVDPSDFFATTTLSQTTQSSTSESSSSKTSSSKASTTLFSSTTRSTSTSSRGATMTPASSADHGLTSSEKSGAIAGGVIGGILVLAIICYLIKKYCGSDRSSSGQPQMAAAPPRFEDGLIADRYGGD